ncbi:MAG: hypothetical protein NBKEAIPA_01736 [Nitrospirae bacterium]|nr:hypothetical protein [Nitrospirota bacterium]
MESRVKPVGLEQLVVRPLLDNLSLLKRVNSLSASDGAQAVGDENDGTSLRDERHVLSNDGFRFIVQCAGRLIKDQNSRIRDQCASNSNPLTLSSRQRTTMFPHDGVVPLRQAENEFVCTGEFCRTDDAVHRQARIRQSDVASHRLVEEKTVLQHHADLPAQPRRIHLCYIHAINQDSPTLRDMQALKESGNRALSGPGSPNDPDHSPRRQGHRNLPKGRRPIRAIPKRHLFEINSSCHYREGRTRGVVGRLGTDIQDVAQTLN